MPSSVITTAPSANYLLQYNSYTFPPGSTYTESLQSTNVLDSANRTVKYVETNLAVVSKVLSPTPGTITVDAQMESIKQTLMSVGGALYYRDKGFGDFNINVPGGLKKDVAWGPTPISFSPRITADAYVWEFTWVVKVRIPWCDAARFEGNIMEWNYQVYYTYDEGGYEERRIQGHIEIPLTRQTQADRFVRASADDYRDIIAPQCPKWFRPGPSYFNLSEDRRKLTFNFQFSQFPGPIPPPGVLKVRMSDSKTNETPMAFNRWSWTLRGEYELLAGTPHKVAYDHFLNSWFTVQQQLIREIQLQRQAKPQQKKNDGAGQNPGVNAGVLLFPGLALLAGLAAEVAKGVFAGIQGAFGVDKKIDKENANDLLIVPRNFSIENPDRYDKPRLNMSVEAMIVGTANIWMSAGMWVKLDGDDDWGRWKKSVDQVFGPRGQLGGKFNPNDDVIIDLCRPGTATLNKLRTPAAIQNNNPKRFEITMSGIPVPINVSSGNSWVELSNNLAILQDDEVVTMKPLPIDRTLASRGGGGILRSGGFSGSVGGLANFIPPTTPEFASTVATQVASTYTIVMTGHARRVGVPGLPTDLVSVGGTPAVPANDSSKGDGYFTTTDGSVGDGLPIYLTVWQFRYLLPAAPGGVAVDPQTGTPIGVIGGGIGVGNGFGGGAPGGRVNIPIQSPAGPGGGLNRF